VRLLLLGYGVMGRTVERLSREGGHTVVAALDRDDPPVAARLSEEVDAAIEFAGPSGAPRRIREAAAVGLPVVSGSTGWSEAFASVAEEVRRGEGALLHAPNLSFGVAIFERIVRRAATLLDVASEYSLDLEETHHTRKVDHPSGTARWLADGVVGGIARLDGWDAELVERGREPEPAAEGRLPVRSRREGDVPGTHTLRATGPDDVLELTHRALRRDGFARGALHAAGWLRGRRGVYTLDDMLDDLLHRSDDAPA